MKPLLEIKGDIAVCYLKGEINLKTASSLKSAFKEIIHGDSKKVIVNLEKVDYIDSMGLATLLGFLKEAEDTGKSFVLCSVTPKISSIFKITRIDKVLDIFDSEKDAVDGVGNG